MATNHGVFENTFQKAKEWVSTIQNELGCDNEREAYAALRAVLHTLRDRSTIDEAVHLGAELPMMIRGTYYEGWDPSQKPLKIVTANEFMEQVDKHFAFTKSNKDPKSIIKVVLKVLESRVTKGEIRDVRSNLSQDILALWPQETIQVR